MKYWRQPLDKDRIRVPRGVVHLIDERLTSKEARCEFGRALEKSGGLDAFAAKLIIETWLSENS